MYCCALLAGLTLGSPASATAISAVSEVGTAPPQGTAVAPSSPNAAQAPGVPAILSAADVELYAAIFELQDAANWKAADEKIASLSDKVLLGRVLAQRYLSPRYATSFAEASAWLEQYADEPEARAVWALARKRAPGKPLQSPVVASTQPVEPLAHLPPLPMAYNLQRPHSFETGLAAWRAKRYAEAAKDFEDTAKSPGTPSWYVAAGAFWAARAHLAAKQPEQVDTWFTLAAEQQRTFYGMLARDTLGVHPDFQSGAHPLTKLEIAQLQGRPAGRRALALVQIGDRDRAEPELRDLSVIGSRDLSDAVVALADIANMPTLCLAMSNRTSDESHRYDALYPVPRWQPRDGFSVDRALLFALMMEESRFDATARNGSGAAGLMQLMPATAKSVAHSAGIPLANVSDLVDPVLNLSIGQAYVKELIGHEQVNGNLILLLAAYNTGPAVLAKLENRPENQGDPLVFIEGLPHQETRLYVERVLTNLWIYRQRLGQQTPDLDALAANKWPAYVSMEVSTTRAEQHAAR